VVFSDKQTAVIVNPSLAKDTIINQCQHRFLKVSEISEQMIKIEDGACFLTERSADFFSFQSACPNLTMLSRFRHVEASYIGTCFIFRLATYYTRDYSKTIQDERTKNKAKQLFILCI